MLLEGRGDCLQEGEIPLKKLFLKNLEKFHPDLLHCDENDDDEFENSGHDIRMKKTSCHIKNVKIICDEKRQKRFVLDILHSIQSFITHRI